MLIVQAPCTGAVPKIEVKPKVRQKVHTNLISSSLKCELNKNHCQEFSNKISKESTNNKQNIHHSGGGDLFDWEPVYSQAGPNRPKLSNTAV